MTETKSNTKRAAATSRRPRRYSSDDDYKMHLRITRQQYERLADDAERRKMTVRDLITERAFATPSSEQVDESKARMPKLVAELSHHGADVVDAALRAMWATNELHRLEAICEAVRLTHARAASLPSAGPSGS